MITAEDEAAGAALYQKWVDEDEASADDFIASLSDEGEPLRIAS